VKSFAGRLRLPSGPERWALAAGALVWVGASAGRATGLACVPVALVVGMVGVARRRSGGALVLAACLVGGSVSGALAVADERATLTAPSPDGPVRVAGWALDDLRPGRNGDWFLLQPTHLQKQGTWIEWQGAPLLVGLKDPVEVAAHQRLQIDGTARPQVVFRQDNPRYYDIISEYYKLSGIPTIINTSFNMHEEPIVCTPEDALSTLLRSGLQYLAMGPYLVTKQSAKAD